MPGGSNTNWSNLESERGGSGVSRGGSDSGGSSRSSKGSKYKGETAKERYARQEKEFDKQAGKDVHKELADKSRSKNEE